MTGGSRGSGFTAVAKRGYPRRLVTYNAGVNQTYMYTTHQDYWAGEMVNLNTPAMGRYLDNGLQWFGRACVDDRGWVHKKLDTTIPEPIYSDEQIVRFVQVCNKQMAPMTFNVGIYQDGTLAQGAVEQLHRLHAALGKWAASPTRLLPFDDHRRFMLRVGLIGLPGWGR